MFFLIGLLLGVIFTFFFEKALMTIKTLRKNFWDNHKSIFGYHFHHSMYGIIALTIGVIIFSDHSFRALFLIGFGVGIILMHTLTEKFVFIEKTTL